MKEEIKKLIEKAIKDLQKEKKLPEFQIPNISIFNSKILSYGDYNTDILFKLNKIYNISPEVIVKPLFKKITSSNTYDKFDDVELLNGFINFFIKDEYLQNQLEVILKEKDKFGNLNLEEKVHPVKSAKGGVARQQFNGVNDNLKDDEVRLLLQVHDELVFEIKNELIKKIAPEIRSIMEYIHRLDVPLIVDVKYGQNWQEMEAL